MSDVPALSVPAIGVDYFPEHWPVERWPVDAQLMVEAGLSVVRIVEFSWSKIQPDAETWEWAWLDQAVEVLASAGLQVILCTPSACPPPWMIEADPAICPVLSTGKTLGLGHRRHYSPHHRGYRDASVEMARRMAERYGQHPAVMAFQIDNELCGNLPDHGPLAAEAFQQWLAKRHGDLQTLDERLGLIFWSQQFSDWSQIPVPTGAGFHPGLQLEFKRFSSEAWVAFCAAQAEVMRPLIGERILTTNCYLHKWGTHIDWSDLVARGGLDRFAFDNYTTSDHENAFYNDLARGLTPGHWILEQQCGLPQGQNLWPDDPDRIAKALHLSVARGAELLTFFRWRQGLFGQEQDHGAILDHHGRKGPTFDEVRQAVSDAADLQPSVSSQLGAVFCWEDSWPLASSPESLDHVAMSIDLISQAAYGAGEVMTWATRPEQLAGLRLILVAGKVLRDPVWEKALIQAAEEGATVMTFPLFGAKDPWNAYCPEYQSPEIRQAQGGELERRINIRGSHKVKTDAGLNLSLRLEAWTLDEQSSVLQRFEDGPAAGEPAVFIRAVGQGFWCTVAGYPDADGLEQLIRSIM